MRVGGNARHYNAPDRVHENGAVTYILSEEEEREATKLFERYCLDKQEFHNTACNAGRNVLLNVLGSPTTNSYFGVQYFAVGNGATVNPSNSDTQLVTEVYRKAITTYTIPGAGNYIDCATVFLTTDTGSNTTYTEAGLFGYNATSSANTGALFNHTQYNYTKSSSINLTNDVFIYLS